MMWNLKNVNFLALIIAMTLACSNQKKSSRSDSQAALSGTETRDSEDVQGFTPDEASGEAEDDNEIVPPDEPSINLSLEDETSENKVLNINLDANVWGVGTGKATSATFALTTTTTVDLTKGVLEDEPSLLIDENKNIVQTEGVEFVGQCQYSSVVNSDSSSTTTLSLNPSIPFAGSAGGSTDFEKALSSTASLTVSGPYFRVTTEDHVDSLKEKCRMDLTDKYSEIIAQQIKILVEQKVVRDEREQLESMMDSIKGGAETVFENVNKVGGVITSVGSTVEDGTQVVTGTAEDVKDTVADGAGSVIDSVGGIFLTEETYALCSTIHIEQSTLQISKEVYTDCQGNAYSPNPPHAIARAIEIMQDIALTSTQYGVSL